MFSSYTDFPKQIKGDLSKLHSFWGLLPTHLENKINQYELTDNIDDIAYDQKNGETKLIQVEKSIVTATGIRVFYTVPESCPIEFHKHTEHSLEISGLETIQLLAKEPSKKYEIRFATDAEYGLQRARMSDIAIDSTINYVFWNYPTVGKSQGHITNIDDYVEAGTKMVEFLKNQGIPAENITLYGIEFGGHIATAVANHFHNQNYPVHLALYQMSSTLFSDLMSRGEGNLNNPNLVFLTHCMLIAQGGCLGFCALGFVFGNFVNTLGVLMAALMYHLGQELTYGLRCLSLDLLADLTDNIVTGLSYGMYELFNALGSLITIGISVPLVLLFGFSFLHAIFALVTVPFSYFGYDLAQSFSQCGTNALGFATHMHIPSKNLVSTMFAQNPESILVTDSPEIEAEIAKMKP